MISKGNFGEPHTYNALKHAFTSLTRPRFRQAAPAVFIRIQKEERHDRSEGTCAAERALARRSVNVSSVFLTELSLRYHHPLTTFVCMRIKKGNPMPGDARFAHRCA